MPNPGTYQNNLEIELVKRDIININLVLDKVSIAIDKSQEISGNISRLVGLLEQRLTNAEKDQDDTNDLIEARRRDRDVEIKEVHEKIDNSVENLTIKIDTTKDSILRELYKLQETFDQTQKELEKELNKIQVWRYTVVGGAAVAIFIISQATNFPDVVTWITRVFSR